MKSQLQTSGLVTSGSSYKRGTCEAGEDDQVVSSYIHAGHLTLSDSCVTDISTCKTGPRAVLVGPPTGNEVKAGAPRDGGGSGLGEGSQLHSATRLDTC